MSQILFSDFLLPLSDILPRKGLLSLCKPSPSIQCDRKGILNPHMQRGKSN